MFRFIKKMFIRLLSFGGSLGSDLCVANSKGQIKCLNNQPCQARPAFFNINSNEPLYYRNWK